MVARMIIDGDLFLMDTRKERFTQMVGSHYNEIPFKVLTDIGDFYYLDYDRRTKNMVNMADGRFPGDFMPVHFPADLIKNGYLEASPDAARYNAASFREEWGTLAIDKSIFDRLAGILPVIDIAGDSYTVDLNRRQLLGNEGDSVISLAGGNPHDMINRFFYDTEQKRQVNLDLRSISAMPENVVLVEVPHMVRLDPIGAARVYGLPDTKLLLKSPIEQNLKAGIIRLSETTLPELIRRNQLSMEGRSGPAETKRLELGSRRIISHG
ncbi:hypothetical protein [Olivibacter jilunii]|uniref:hypothetical protein n=1 Tax=Olivibacter jilunii TaxID=985016 RepID=UPI001030286C|nr:hypothetical protein [Olivibacter jilunii]